MTSQTKYNQWLYLVFDGFTHASQEDHSTNHRTTARIEGFLPCMNHRTTARRVPLSCEGCRVLFGFHFVWFGFGSGVFRVYITTQQYNCDYITTSRGLEACSSSGLVPRLGWLGLVAFCGLLANFVAFVEFRKVTWSDFGQMQFPPAHFGGMSLLPADSEEHEGTVGMVQITSHVWFVLALMGMICFVHPIKLVLNGSLFLDEGPRGSVATKRDSQFLSRAVGGTEQVNANNVEVFVYEPHVLPKRPGPAPAVEIKRYEPHVPAPRGPGPPSMYIKRLRRNLSNREVGVLFATVTGGLSSLFLYNYISSGEARTLVSPTEIFQAMLPGHLAMASLFLV